MYFNESDGDWNYSTIINFVLILFLLKLYTVSEKILLNIRV